MTDELPRIGVELLFDIDETPPAPLLLGRYHPDDHTILFADGGVGKGVLAARDHVVMLRDDPSMILGIVDYEQHARAEWKPRMRQFAETIAHDPDLLKRIHVIGIRPDISLWDAAMKDVKPFIDDLGINRLLVDSAAYACGALDPESSMAPRMYSAAIAELRLPTTTLAHVTKTNLDPPHPYGSVFWSNGARVTIGMVGTGEAGPRVLRNKKTNQNSRFLPEDIDWSWTERLGPGEMPKDLEFSTHNFHTVDRIIAVLRDGQARQIDEIAEIASLDGGGELKPDTVKHTLSRWEPRGAFVSDGKRPSTWTLGSAKVTRNSVPLVDEN